jgi:Xaa-Pro dipeptidase
MTFDERLARIRAAMSRNGIDLLIGVHDGAHFIEKPNPVMVLAGFKSLGAAAAVIERDGGGQLIVGPRWDRERAAEQCPGLHVTGTDNMAAGLIQALESSGAARGKTVGIAGLSALPSVLAQQLAGSLRGARNADEMLFDCAEAKTVEEIAHAREATRIAELGYERLLEIAKPGVSEDELAVEVRWHSKSLGAEDNFLLLCGSPHNRAVQPSTGRRLAEGDIIVVEITPSYRGQLAQICRTIVLGKPSDTLVEKYALVTEAMNLGMRAAVPGVAMAEVCGAINRRLESGGYAEYCHPPHIRRRGHGLGFASVRPGDVALDNDTILKPGMVFMIHPNQYLPETGYLLCGEPVIMTDRGAEPLTRRQATLAESARASSRKVGTGFRKRSCFTNNRECDDAIIITL